MRVSLNLKFITRTLKVETFLFFQLKPLLNCSKKTLHLCTAYQWNQSISFKYIKKKKKESEPDLSHCSWFIIWGWLTALDRKRAVGKRKQSFSRFVNFDTKAGVMLASQEKPAGGTEFLCYCNRKWKIIFFFHFCSDPRTKRADRTKGCLGMQEWKK